MTLRFGVVVVFLSLVATNAVAQTTGLGGVVKDTTGAVLPGVTVEASSPALIEKVRMALTDSQGLYRIVDLRPGTYSVTFTLPGFTTVKREGIKLEGSFTATIDAELSVGAVEETLTVTGQSPMVDTHNVVQQRVLTEDVRELLPAARSVQTMAAVIPGIVSTGGDRPSPQDVGGITGERGTLLIHGSRNNDFTIQMDGAPLYNAFGSGFSQSYTFNPAEAQEYVYEVGAVSAAHMTGGVRANVIPKEGGNRFSAFFLASYTNENLQSDNLSDDLISRGLSTPNTVEAIWDYNVSVGGPVMRDKVWFFGSYRYWGQRERVAGMFRMLDPTAFIFNPALGAAGNADLGRPVANETWLASYGLRLTWNINEKNKVSVYGAHQPREKLGTGVSGTVSYEAGSNSPAPINQLISATWKSTFTSRLLFEAAWASPLSLIPAEPTVPGIVPDLVSVTDTGTGLTYRAKVVYNRPKYATPTAASALSFVTGSHVAKFGVEYGWGYDDHADEYVNQGMSYTLRNEVPQSITVYVAPRHERESFRSLGLYAQDQWRFRRLTVNAGLRFDYHNEWIPEQSSGPGAWVPLQSWLEVKDVPNWKDVSPRLGVSYDVFGNGRTAVKASLSRYVVRDLTGFAKGSNPLLANLTATRQWTDANRDYFPQESELQPLSNSAFGTPATTTRDDDGIRDGWSVRAYNWEGSASIQHELLPQVSLNVAYTRRSYGNFTVTDNLTLVPGDYDPYCITPPSNTQIPEVGGEQICGFYDLNPAKRSVVPDNLRTDAANYGDQKETWNGIDVGVNMRLPHRVQLAGGVSSGTNSGTSNSKEACFVIDSPQALRFCDVNYPWLTTFKMFGTVGLPAGFDAAATFQTSPGSEIQANFAVTNAVVDGLGRPLTFTSTVPLMEPGTVFGDRLYQLDLRIAKSFRLNAFTVRMLLDVANALNANAVLLQNNAYGANWLRPTYILPGRVFKPTVEVTF
jgi:carboxypeptidase family protein